MSTFDKGLEFTSVANIEFVVWGGKTAWVVDDKMAIVVFFKLFFRYLPKSPQKTRRFFSKIFLTVNFFSAC